MIQYHLIKIINSIKIFLTTNRLTGKISSIAYKLNRIECYTH